MSNSNLESNTVFLSYRPSDTGGEAGRLADTFQQKLGGWLTFRDVSSIPLGEQFPWVLQSELAAAKTMLVLIGPEWLVELRRRLAQSDVDYVRLEISTALATRKRIIPILLKGAAQPTVQDLSEDIGSLAKYQAMTLRDESWSQDVDRLIDAIGRPYPWKNVALCALATLLPNFRCSPLSGWHHHYR
ncbi:MAG TPA: toll/interleukin-1 receptor domain-containing protein [Terrimicrobiaceae bacterium]